MCVMFDIYTMQKKQSSKSTPEWDALSEHLAFFQMDTKRKKKEDAAGNNNKSLLILYISTEE